MHYSPRALYAVMRRVEEQRREAQRLRVEHMAPQHRLTQEQYASLQVHELFDILSPSMILPLKITKIPSSSLSYHSTISSSSLLSCHTLIPSSSLLSYRSRILLLLFSQNVCMPFCCNILLSTPLTEGVLVMCCCGCVALLAVGDCGVHAPPSVA